MTDHIYRIKELESYVAKLRKALNSCDSIAADYRQRIQGEYFGTGEMDSIRRIARAALEVNE